MKSRAVNIKVLPEQRTEAEPRGCRRFPHFASPVVCGWTMDSVEEAGCCPRGWRTKAHTLPTLCPWRRGRPTSTYRFSPLCLGQQAPAFLAGPLLVHPQQCQRCLSRRGQLFIPAHQPHVPLQHPLSCAAGRVAFCDLEILGLPGRVGLFSSPSSQGSCMLLLPDVPRCLPDSLLVPGLLWLFGM